MRIVQSRGVYILCKLGDSTELKGSLGSIALSDKTSDRFTFACTACGATIAIDENKPLNDEDILHCPDCKRAIGPFGTVRDALVNAAKAEIDKLVGQRFGKPPTWGR